MQYCQSALPNFNRFRFNSSINCHGEMPVVTRSARKQNARLRIEDPTPNVDSSKNSRARSIRNTTAKRKLIPHSLENVEPPAKRKNATKRRGPQTKQQNQNSQAPSKIPVKCNDVEGVESNEKASESTSLNACIVEAENAAQQQVPNTPSCISARTRTYSELHRSQRGKLSSHCCDINTQASEVPSSQGSCSQDVSKSVLSDAHEIDENEEANTPSICVVTDSEPHEQQDQDKYSRLVMAMKQLQASFLRAQQNAEKNITAFDDIVQSLKSSLKTEQQKNLLLREDLTAKKETVQKMRKDMQSLCNEMQVLQQQKHPDDLKKQDGQMDETSASVAAVLTGESNEAKRIIAEQKSIINLYSKLTGILLCRDVASADSATLDSYVCTCYPTEDNNDNLSFRLTLDKEFEDIEYSPKLPTLGNTNVLQRLPDYLQENIFFENSQAPKFLARFLKSLEALR